ncbi:MAG: ATP-binding protein [Desulfurococcaceae archaeon]
MEDLIDKLNENYSEAVKIAQEIGEIVGWVSRTSPSSLSEEGGFVYFDVEPAIYFKDFLDIASTGSYLAVVDIKTRHVISLVVVSVERKDVLAELEVPDMWTSTTIRELSGLLTKTRIKAKLLLAYDIFRDETSIASYVIEPQSPVIKLKDTRIIHRLLGLPDKGVFLGYVSIGDRPLFDANAPLYLPLRAFYQHVLILGTTGSGKTTLLKNMIASIYSLNTDSANVSLLIMDPNMDYVTMILKPVWDLAGLNKELEEKMISKVNGSIRKPNGLIIILPVTKFAVENFELKNTSWAKLLKRIAESYVENTYFPIANRYGWRINIDNIEVGEEDVKPPLRYVKIDLKIDYVGESSNYELFIIPYGFRFKDMDPQEFISLNPYFTRQARDGLVRLLNYAKLMNIDIETIYELYDILREARFRIEEKKQSIASGKIRDIVELIKSLAIHKSTLENIIRQIGSVVDSGLFDIEVSDAPGEDRILREPPIGYLMEKHISVFRNYPVIVDLSYPQEHSYADPEKVISIVAFRILNSVFKWKVLKSRQKVLTQPVIIVFDEAHRFFPSREGGREEYIEQVSSMIDRIARLGRARRMGLIFSTHSPKDVHDIILQLTNTKIILRMDKSQISVLDLPEEYRDLVLRASDRVGVIRSHIYRTGYAVFKTTLPLLGHFDLSII